MSQALETRGGEARAHLVERAAEALGAFGPKAERLPPRPDAPPRPPASVLAIPPAASAPAVTVPPPPANATIGLAALQAAGLATLPDTPVRSRVLEETEVVAHGVARAVAQAASKDAARSRIVLVASALRGEGKTFIALNIAARLAGGGGGGIVLVDADGRRGGLSHVLGVADRPGLRQLALDVAARPASLPLRTELDRLTVLPYGADPSAGGDLPSGAMLATAVSRLAAAMPNHLIILDTPPSLSTSEPSALAAVAGQVVLVVGAERTQRNEVEAALDMLEACPVLQLLLNRVRFDANDTFGAHGHYGAPDAS